MTSDIDRMLQRFSIKEIIKYLISKFSLAQILEELRVSGEYRLRESVYREIGSNLANHIPGFSSVILASTVTDLIEFRQPTDGNALNCLRQKLLKISVSYQQNAGREHSREIVCWLKGDHGALQIRSSTNITWEELPEDVRRSFLEEGNSREEFNLFVRNSQEKG